MSAQGWAGKAARLLELDQTLDGNLVSASQREFLQKVVSEPFECYHTDKAWIEYKTTEGLRLLREPQSQSPMPPLQR